MSIRPGSDRIFGLDLMRAMAIVLVVRSHADDLLDRYWPADTGVPDLDGVDLFFVLSGYLVGGILLRYQQATEVPWPRRLLDFWLRRWLRTLPNYFLFLGVNIVLVYLALGPGVLNINTLAYFVFLQNMVISLDLMFLESWSLAVEEWFYLAFPILLMLLGVVVRRRQRLVFLIGALAMITIPAVLRSPAMEGVGTLFDLDRSVRRIVVLRLDTIGFGVLAAWVQYHLPALWSRRAPEVFLIGAIGLVTATLLRGPERLVYMGTWYFTMSAFSMALLLPVLSSWKSTGRWGAPIIFLSRISYALYLVNLPVRYLYIGMLVDRSQPFTIALYVGYWVLCLGLAWLVYRYFERPFMDLRDRLSQRIVGRSITSSS